jgi:hypothetical protein
MTHLAAISLPVAANSYYIIFVGGSDLAAK